MDWHGDCFKPTNHHYSLIQMKVISQSGSSTGPTAIKTPISGAGMDRVIEKKTLPLRTVAIVIGVISVVVLVGWYLFDQGSGRSLVIQNNRIVIYALLFELMNKRSNKIIDPLYSLAGPNHALA